MNNSESRSKDKSQADKFREAAEQAETDDDEKRFDDRLRRLTKSPANPGKGKPTQ